MERNEYERKLRYRMCILMALETIMICYSATKYIDKRMIYNWDGVYYHYYPPAIYISVFAALSASFILPAALTLLSMRFKWVYRIYEILHLIAGGYVFLLFLDDMSYPNDMLFYDVLGHVWYDGIVALCLSVFLSARFWVYIRLLKKHPLERTDVK